MRAFTVIPRSTPATVSRAHTSMTMPLSKIRSSKSTRWVSRVTSWAIMRKGSAVGSGPSVNDKGERKPEYSPCAPSNDGELNSDADGLAVQSHHDWARVRQGTCVHSLSEVAGAQTPKPYFSAFPSASTTVTGPYLARVSWICRRSPTHIHCMCAKSTNLRAAA
jgi:hypothetical protein